MKFESIKNLRWICQGKGKGGGRWYTNVVLRKISIYFTWLFLLTPITANQITVLRLVFGLASAALFSIGNAWFFLIGTISLQFSEVLDCCDGEVARYRRQTSATGGYLDPVLGTVVIPFLFIGITFGAAKSFPNSSNFVFFSRIDHIN